MTEIFITAEGYKKLDDRLTYLKSVKRTEIAQRIEHAISYGDLSENSEYKSAREDQTEMELEIAKLEQQLQAAKIIKKGANKGDTITVGSVVDVNEIDFNEKVTYTISGTLESDPQKNIVSNESPIGKALMGKKKGDTVQYNTPNGKFSLKILAVKN